MPARVLCIVAVSALLHVSVSSSSVELLSDGDFYEKIKRDVWVVAFTATWCGHCKKLAPILEDLGRDVQAGSTGIRIAKVAVLSSIYAKRFMSCRSTLRPIPPLPGLKRLSTSRPYICTVETLLPTIVVI